MTSTGFRVQVCHLSKLVHLKVNLEHSPLVTFLVTQYQFILIVSRDLNTSSRSIITCSMYLLYSITF